MTLVIDIVNFWPNNLILGIRYIDDSNSCANYHDVKAKNAGAFIIDKFEKFTNYMC